MTIGERIKEVRKSNGLTQQKFADRLSLKRNTIANYEINLIEPSDRTISDVCRIFGVNEVWLRTGEGEMFAHKSREAEFSAACGEILRNCQDEETLAVLTRVISALAKVDWSGVDLVQKRVDEIKKEE